MCEENSLEQYLLSNNTQETLFDNNENKRHKKYYKKFKQMINQSII